MKGRIWFLDAQGTRDSIELTEPPALEVLRKGVGGHIETIPHFDSFIEPNGTIEGTPKPVPCVAYCNEEGKLNGFPPNVQATNHWIMAQKKNGVRINDILCGGVVVIIGDEELMESL